MFLGDVLKITDLKRLLKKKFSKEKDWTQKMREMHQFYTYLEYSTEQFRANLAKNN
jgi:malonyl CoA-acyl carrier protein transacylase